MQTLADSTEKQRTDQEILDECRSRAPLRKKNKVVLIQPQKGGRPSFGPLYIGAYLLDNGYDVRVYEFLDEKYPPNARYNEKILAEILRFSPEFIGINSISSAFRVAQTWTKRFKKLIPDVTVIMGGKHPSSNPQDFLDDGADFCAIHEAEVTIVELLDALNFNKPLEKVNGIAMIKNGQFFETAPRVPLDMNDLLNPALHLIDYQKYINFRLQAIPGHYLKTAFIFGSRGCPYTCDYCVNNSRLPYRERSVDALINEMIWQMSNYDIEAFCILDDLFYSKDNRVREFMQKYKDLGLKAKLYFHARANKANIKTIQMMKEAGVLMMAIGVESGSQKILNNVDKGCKVEDIEKSFKVFNQVGIDTLAHFIIGHPDENQEDRDLSMKLIEKIKPTYVCANYYTPMPGTPSLEHDIENAKYLVGGENFKELSYRIDIPEYSNDVPLDILKSEGNRLESGAVKNRNRTIFGYPGFLFFCVSFIFLHPVSIIEGLYYRYVKHVTHQFSLFEVLKDSMQFRSLMFNRKYK